LVAVATKALSVGDPVFSQPPQPGLGCSLLPFQNP